MTLWGNGPSLLSETASLYVSSTLRPPPLGSEIFTLSFNVGWLYFRGESLTFISIRLIHMEVWKTTWDPRWGSAWPFHTPALLYTEISSSRAKGFCRQVDSNLRRPYTGSTLAPGSKSASAPGGVRVRTVGYVGMESFLSSFTLYWFLEHTQGLSIFWICLQSLDQITIPSLWGEW